MGQLSLCSTTAEPTCHNDWNPHTLEPVLHSKKSPACSSKDPAQHSPHRQANKPRVCWVLGLNCLCGRAVCTKAWTCIVLNPLFLWASLKIDSLHGYPANESEKLTQVVNISRKAKEGNQVLFLCLLGGPSYIWKCLYFHLHFLKDILLLFWYFKDATPMRRLLIYTISNEKFDVIFIPLHIMCLFSPLADFFFSLYQQVLSNLIMMCFSITCLFGGFYCFFLCFLCLWSLNLLDLLFMGLIEFGNFSAITSSDFFFSVPSLSCSSPLEPQSIYWITWYCPTVQWCSFFLIKDFFLAVQGLPCGTQAHELRPGLSSCCAEA